MDRQKISAEEKIKVVEAYENREIEYKEAIAAYRIHPSTFQAWIRNYKVLGHEGLLDKQKQKDYPTELRMEAAYEYLNGACSQAAIC